LNGRGQQASQRFDLERGLTIFRLQHSGQRNFIVSLVDSNGRQADGLVNVIGPFEGGKAVGIANAGEYLANVQADGEWTITVEQPKPTGADAPPRTFEGHGQMFSPFFQLEGRLVTFKLKHGGQRNFIVSLLDANGRQAEGLVNHIGPFDGSKAVGQRRGLHLLNIQADGEWVITVE
jgi:hypothetical protein